MLIGILPNGHDILFQHMQLMKLRLVFLALADMEAPVCFTLYGTHVMISLTCFSGFIWLQLEDT